jgi:hypothetical protein
MRWDMEEGLEGIGGSGFALIWWWVVGLRVGSMDGLGGSVFAKLRRCVVW